MKLTCGYQCIHTRLLRGFVYVALSSYSIVIMYDYIIPLKLIPMAMLILFVRAAVMIEPKKRDGDGGLSNIMSNP